MGTRIGFSYFIILCLCYKILSYRFLTFMCLFTLASCDFQLGIGGIGVEIRELTIHYVKQCDDLMSGSHMVDHVVEVHGLRSSTAYVTTRIRKNQFSYNHCIRSALLLLSIFKNTTNYTSNCISLLTNYSKLALFSN